MAVSIKLPKTTNAATVTAAIATAIAPYLARLYIGCSDDDDHRINKNGPATKGPIIKIQKIATPQSSIQSLGEKTVLIVSALPPTSASMIGIAAPTNALIYHGCAGRPERDRQPIRNNVVSV